MVFVEKAGARLALSHPTVVEASKSALIESDGPFGTPVGDADPPVPNNQCHKNNGRNREPGRCDAFHPERQRSDDDTGEKSHEPRVGDESVPLRLKFRSGATCFQPLRVFIAWPNSLWCQLFYAGAIHLRAYMG